MCQNKAFNLILAGLVTLISQNVLAGTMGDTKEFNFNGAYLGLGTGVMTNMLTNKYTVTNYGNGIKQSPSFHDSASGVMFSGKVGFGKLVYDKTYLGAKGDILYTPINNYFSTGFSKTPSSNLVIGNNNVTISFKPIYSISAVLGYEVYQNIMPFIQGGVSFTGINRRYTLMRTLTNLNSSSSVSYDNLVKLNKYTTGYNIGLGTNYHPFSNLILSGELMFFGFGKISESRTFTIPPNNLIGTRATTSKSVNINTLALLVSASYLFA